MEREHRYLDRESNKERQEDPILEVVRQIGRDGMEGQHIERVPCPELSGDVRMLRRDRRINKIQRQNSKQQQNRSDQCVEEELDRSIKLARAAPYTDEEVHRH